ncbi:MAG: hypothetical protein NVSMB6_13090 [Burkholderiaceae bacterium]
MRICLPGTWADADGGVRDLHRSQQPIIFRGLSHGFLLPGDDTTESRLDLTNSMIQNTIAAFFFRVQGDSMSGSGSVDGNYPVVDGSISPRSFS